MNGKNSFERIERKKKHLCPWSAMEMRCYRPLWHSKVWKISKCEWFYKLLSDLWGFLLFHNSRRWCRNTHSGQLRFVSLLFVYFLKENWKTFKGRIHLVTWTIFNQIFPLFWETAVNSFVMLKIRIFFCHCWNDFNVPNTFLRIISWAVICFF